MSKKVGIIGGMGPLATVDLFAKIVNNTPANIDQDHIRIIIDNNPQIPSRVDAILEGTESPLSAMQQSAKLLEIAGASFIILACNTAHHWIKDLRASVSIPVYSIIENAATYISMNHRRYSGHILLLATEATISLGLYQQAFENKNMLLQIPTHEEQAIFYKAIRRVKAGELSSNSYISKANSILSRYAEEGTVAILAGCTEIPLLFPFLTDRLIKLDATLILAQMVIEQATNKDFKG